MVASQNDLKCLCQNLTSIKDICGAVGLVLAAQPLILAGSSILLLLQELKGAESPPQMPASSGEGEGVNELGQWAAASQGLARPRGTARERLADRSVPRSLPFLLFPNRSFGYIQSQRAFQKIDFCLRQQDAILLLEFKDSE